MDVGSMVLNLNVGVLGHVDSGKTSLSRAISTVASTACFDKNPQSRERGITLDLGFSSFAVPIPDHLKNRGYDVLQFTLVDCPGHASLIRTVLGGAQIIDLVLLVVDIVKGVQTQTAECLIIAEILCSRMVVLLNKIDLIPAADRGAAIERSTKKMARTLEATRFKGCPIVAIAASPGAEENREPLGLNDFRACLEQASFIPDRSSVGPLVFSVDHCFLIRGQGTVMTGTVLGGSLSVNDNIEIPSLHVQRKVKSIQVFHKPVERIQQGDRAGVCVTQFDPKLLERGIACTLHSVPLVYALVIDVHRIPYFKGSCCSKTKFHVTIGYETVLARVYFLNNPACDGVWDRAKEYHYRHELNVSVKGQNDTVHEDIFCLLVLEKPVLLVPKSLVICSKLDTGTDTNLCRIALHGRVMESFTSKDFLETVLPTLNVVRTKSKSGVVERLHSDDTVIVKNLFKKETNMELFINMKVELSTGESGNIVGGFGQSGKTKVHVSPALKETTRSNLAGPKKKADRSSEETSESQIRVELKFKKQVFNKSKPVRQ